MIVCPSVDIGTISPSKQVGLISFPITPKMVLIPIQAMEIKVEGSVCFDSRLVTTGTVFKGVAASLAKNAMSFLACGFYLF